MAREIKSEIIINASAESVWANLMDFESYPNWNPFVRSIIGEQKEGAKLKIFLKNNGLEMTIKPKVKVVAANKEFRWLGRLVLPRFFDGEHIFEIESISDNQVRFIQREHFRGILVPLLLGRIEADTRHSFEAMNRALKDRVEN
ncbi:MAG: SRPBCC family protein [Candidatus Kariarchaeaceae archaeon]|jgi:hypothetical protein